MMPKFLLDTMIVSEGFKKIPYPSVVSWLEKQDTSDLVISVVTFGEIAAGMEKQRKRDLLVFRRLEAWLQSTRAEYAERNLPITAAIAIEWGAMCSRLKRKDTDLLLAATALEHDLTLVTRNVRHFEQTGVKLFDPYQ